MLRLGSSVLPVLPVPIFRQARTLALPSTLSAVVLQVMVKLVMASVALAAPLVMVPNANAPGAVAVQVVSARARGAQHRAISISTTMSVRAPVMVGRSARSAAARRGVRRGRWR